ncbi:hypothetical protein L3Q82_016992 [Scortum barcoo]|uniref:Uncharacterized protein n=1 Tax=Scortum barcoo TaxID=214431 RepID=A0ACB8X8A3_9TELE|nr:hypothetical protein L3Q82_016992 [Scortum barcoo]
MLECGLIGERSYIPHDDGGEDGPVTSSPGAGADPCTASRLLLFSLRGTSGRSSAECSFNKDKYLASLLSHPSPQERSHPDTILIYTNNLSSHFLFFITTERNDQEQKVRIKVLRETCGRGNYSFEDINQEHLRHLIVDDKHGIIYCFLPKVACTNWKRVMYVLAQGEPYSDPSSISGKLVHFTNKIVGLNTFPRPEIKAKLKHYTKFLFVRHPFIRLISAYRDKFQKNNEFYYHNFARDILRLYGNQPHPPHSVNDAFAAGIRMSFNNFIQYLLDPRTERRAPFEPHWRQMHRLCHPCHIPYDFVGHQETLQEDADHLLKLVGLDDDIKFPPTYEKETSDGFMEDFFKDVPLEDRRKLYKLYREDFRLFGYTDKIQS